jgi:hypothetical protein
MSDSEKDKKLEAIKKAMQEEGESWANKFDEELAV